MNLKIQETAQAVSELLNTMPDTSRALINSATKDGQKAVLDVAMKHGMNTTETAVFLQFLASSYFNAAARQDKQAEAQPPQN